MHNTSHYIEKLIQADICLVDKSSKYIRSVYPSELSVSSFLKRDWIFGTKVSVRSFFKPCKKVKKCSWDIIFSQWSEINSNMSTTETDCCPHTEHLKDDLEKSINANQYKQLTFFWTEQIVIVPVSKRIGKHYIASKIYAYCPTCLKIFCIGGFKSDYEYMNLIENSFLGLILVTKVWFKAKKLQSQRVSRDKSICTFGHGSCYSVWKIQKDILKTKYDIIWYSPADLHPRTLFD